MKFVSRLVWFNGWGWSLRPLAVSFPPRIGEIVPSKAVKMVELKVEFGVNLFPGIH